MFRGVVAWIVFLAERALPEREVRRRVQTEGGQARSFG